jgi:acyl-CoA synthetase (AMP-forming)/AMP-acid ligase II
MTDLVAAFLATCTERGDAPALRTPATGTLTYRELGQRVEATAHGLVAAGLRPRDRVLFSVRPSAEGLVLTLAIVAAGGTVVFADPGVGEELFRSRFALAAPAWAAAESLLYAAGASRPGRMLARRRGVLLPDYSSLPVRHLYAGRWLPGVPRGARSTRALGRAAGSGLPAGDPDAEALVVFTSGTTSAPKAVVHTRGSIGALCRSLIGEVGFGPGATVHTDQFMVGLPALLAGAFWTMPAYGFAPSADVPRYLAALDGATHTFCVPADLDAVLARVERGEATLPASVRCLLLGGAPVLPPLLRRARVALPEAEILAVYGMTEILPVAIATAEQKLGHDGPGDPVGTVVPGVTARIATDGELVLSGSQLCRGYLGQDPLTDYATGDLAEWQGELLVLVGRKKDMIIRGRTNIYPGLYEPAIARLPGVEAAVIAGVPDEIGDERVVLAVVPAGGGSVTARKPAVLRGHELAGSVAAALPGLIDLAALPDLVIVIDHLPVTGRTSKPDRDAVRVVAGEELMRSSNARSRARTLT